MRFVRLKSDSRLVIIISQRGINSSDVKYNRAIQYSVISFESKVACFRPRKKLHPQQEYSCLAPPLFFQSITPNKTGSGSEEKGKACEKLQFPRQAPEGATNYIPLPFRASINVTSLWYIFALWKKRNLKMFQFSKHFNQHFNFSHHFKKKKKKSAHN